MAPGSLCATVAIVGASGRAAAASALQSGLKPRVADLFADADLQRICPVTRIVDYPRELASWLERESCDAWIYVGGLENHPRLIDRMASQSRLLGNAGIELRSVRSLPRLAKALREQGLRFPETRRDCPGFADPMWIRKPLRGSGGGAVCSADVPGTLLRRAVLQKKVKGESVAALFLANGRHAVTLGVTEQLVGVDWTGAKPFQYCGSIGPRPTTPIEKKQIDAIGETLADRFGLVGLFGADLVIDDQQVWTIEVNPRYTAATEVVQRTLASPLFAWHIEACLHRKLPLLEGASSRGAAGKAIVYAQKSLYIDRDASRRLLERMQSEGPWSLADIPSPETHIGPGQPVLTLLASGSCPKSVRSRLQQGAGRLRRELGDLGGARSK